MLVEEKLPEVFRRHCYHPSYFIYAWKRRILEKLFEEIVKSNILIESCEVWLIEKEIVETLIPLKSGEIQVFSCKILANKDEEWFDFVERAANETEDQIEDWSLETNVRRDLASKIYYNFKLREE